MFDWYLIFVRYTYKYYIRAVINITSINMIAPLKVKYYQIFLFLFLFFIDDET